MSTGGRWRDERPGFVATQIERHIAEGHAPWLAERYCRAMASGGLTEAEALAVIRDRDCRNGSAHELVDPEDLPDRWFRNAWRRSHNGGPISLDLEACRHIQWGKIQEEITNLQTGLRGRLVFAEEWTRQGYIPVRPMNKEELDEHMAWARKSILARGGDLAILNPPRTTPRAKVRLRKVNLGRLRDAILTADEPEHIRRIWIDAA